MSAAAALAYLTAPLKDGQDDRIASSPLLRTQSLSRPSIPFPSRYLGSKYIVMSVGRRTSVLSTASTRVLAITLLAGFLPGVKANCWIDSDGFETCDGLSNLARALIGLAFFLVFLAVIFGLFAFRRRRNRQANLAYIQQSQRGSGAGYGGPPYGTPGGPPFTPQYPPPAHNGLNPPYTYDPSAGFASPSVSPPQYYPPPPGAPPIPSYHK